MSFKQYSAATDVGLKRTNNEDTILSNPHTGLWLVADGMGGHAAGEVASAIVAETIDRQIAQGQSLQRAIELAHEAVIKAAEAGIGGTGMGSTVVALYSQGLSYQIAWVGDSRAYLWQPPAEPANTHGESDDQVRQLSGQGELIQLTSDHSYVQMLFDSGVINAEEMQQHPDKNIITQCLGSLDIETLTVDICQMKWYPNDRILLCSDGLTDAVSSAQIQQILKQHPDTEAATRALIAQALDQGGKDNISVALINCPNGVERGLQSARSYWRRWKTKLGL